MIFRGLAVKKSEGGYFRLINLKTGDEASADEDAMLVLERVCLNECMGDLASEEDKLLGFISGELGVECHEGLGNISIRSGPLDNLDVNLTTSCNLECRHCCVYGENLDHNNTHIEYERLKVAIADAYAMGVVKLRLSGGEPLLYYNLNDLLCYLRKFDMNTTFVTNGTLLGEHLSEMAREKTSLVVSLDGFKEAHDYLRGSGAYEKTLRNVVLAARLGFDVEVSMVVYSDNVSSVSEFSRFLHGIGVSRLNVQVLRPVGAAQIHMCDRVVTDPCFLRDIHCNELAWQKQKIESGRTFCTSCKTGLTVNSRGDVFGCSFITEVPLGNLKELSLGTLYEAGLRDNPLFNLGDNVQCVRCELFMNECAGGCRARAGKISGSLDACDYWIPFLLNHAKFNECGKNPHEFLLI